VAAPELLQAGRREPEPEPRGARGGPEVAPS
jgi:hypothetical protein